MDLFLNFVKNVQIELSKEKKQKNTELLMLKEVLKDVERLGPLEKD
jgi:hypothetical protein